MLPFEFIVVGVPVSYQAVNRLRLADWRRLVRAAAMRRWPTPQLPLMQRLKITVVYYYEGDVTRLDNDNLLKPIQDALNGLVYVDNRLLTDTVVRKTSIDGRFLVRGLSSVHAEGFTRGAAFIYVRIDEAPDHAELL